jgi:hypothetical protein
MRYSRQPSRPTTPGKTTMLWYQITVLGGLNVTALGALAIAVWLGAARCWRLALAWCLLFGAAMLLTVASQVVFLGWGIGIQSIDFAGFSGHATRAAAVFPVAFFLLLEGEDRRLRASRSVRIRRRRPCSASCLGWRSRCCSLLAPTRPGSSCRARCWWG